ncbi:MAG TPA: hypothetical protein VN541_23490 [Tepidisphaeraceae bacterium]|nr:hypothetical protein [Tepidisphaeraceae bacterium]
MTPCPGRPAPTPRWPIKSLTEAVRETLVQGWYFNIDKNYWLYRDGFGNIFLPANTASVEINRNKYPTIEPVMRPQFGGRARICRASASRPRGIILLIFFLHVLNPNIILTYDFTRRRTHVRFKSGSV